MKAFLSILIVGLFSLPVAAQIPVLSSYPSARAVIFLDFDGQTVQGTGWNWSGPIYAQPAGLSSAAVTEIFTRVAEDYRIFNINITTDSTLYASAPVNKRTRVIITPTSQWYGAAGGVAYMGSFTWGDDTPCWVFSALLNNNIKYVAEAASHEAGHTLGLQHQSSFDANCTKTAEYAGGQGSGEISWAPIMGVGYYKNLTTWHIGPNTIGCTSIQNDIEILAGPDNGIGLRSDDHGNKHQQATDVIQNASGFIASGLINTAADKDVFRFRIDNTTHFQLSAIPQNVGGANSGANVDIRISLLNQNGDTLNRYNPSELVSAIVDTSLNSSTYYLVVEGVGNLNLADAESMGFFSLNANFASALPLDDLKLAGNVSNGQHKLYWNWQDLRPVTARIEYSLNGRDFNKLVDINEKIFSYQYEPTRAEAIQYRIRMTNEEGRVYYTNVISLAGIGKAVIRVNQTLVQQELEVWAAVSGEYRLVDLAGRTFLQGKLQSGVNRLHTTQLPKGLFYLQTQCENNKQVFKLIKQ